MTIRVSRDSGHTYGPRIDVRPTDNLLPDATSAWPPCQCPKHRLHSPPSAGGELGKAAARPTPPDLTA